MRAVLHWEDPWLPLPHVLDAGGVLFEQTNEALRRVDTGAD
jgi:hypothetical protein